MDWTEYAAIAEAFRAKFGAAPPTLFTPQGALEYMRRALRGQSGWTGAPTEPTRGLHKDS
jgi:hypothetical protein